MREYMIEDIKEFMNEIFVNERYDSFYLYEARIKTALDYYVGGKINRQFYDSDSLDRLNGREYAEWRETKGHIFDLIKGDTLPISFRIILMFSRDNIERLVEMNNLPLTADDIGALFFNVNYAGGALTVTTGTSVKMFSMDKTLDNIWDETVNKYYVSTQLS